MPARFEEAARLDRLVHEPARLAILTALAVCASADFLFLQRLTGLTKGNLSAHLAKLHEAGLVLIEKRLVGKVPNTQILISPLGRSAVTSHWRQLENLKKGAERLRKEATSRTGEPALRRASGRPSNLGRPTIQMEE